MLTGKLSANKENHLNTIFWIKNKALQEKGYPVVACILPLAG